MWGHAKGSLHGFVFQRDVQIGLRDISECSARVERGTREERWVSADHREIGTGLEQHRKACRGRKAVGAW